MYILIFLFIFVMFSWHEIGTQDLPAMIDYILETTGREKLFYLGHSQGTTVFFAMASERPEYQSKIEAMFALAPIVFCGRMKSPFFQILSHFTITIEVCTFTQKESLYIYCTHVRQRDCGFFFFLTLLQVISELIGINEFAPNNALIKKAQQIMCADDAITQPVCSNAIFLVTEFNHEQMNKVCIYIYYFYTYFCTYNNDQNNMYMYLIYFQKKVRVSLYNYNLQITK